jgi:hypothetical protein
VVGGDIEFDLGVEVVVARVEFVVAALNLEGDDRQKADWTREILEVFRELGLFEPRSGDPGVYISFSGR